MKTMRVSLLRIRMTLRAGDLQRRGVVHQALHILVAIHAAEHAAVNRMFHLRRVHVQAHRLAVDFSCQRGIGVAAKTILILELLLCVRGNAAQNNIAAIIGAMVFPETFTPSRRCFSKSNRSDWSHKLMRRRAHLPFRRSQSLRAS